MSAAKVSGRRWVARVALVLCVIFMFLNISLTDSEGVKHPSGGIFLLGAIAITIGLFVTRPRKTS